LFFYFGTNISLGQHFSEKYKKKNKKKIKNFLRNFRNRLGQVIVENVAEGQQFFYKSTKKKTISYLILETGYITVT
jgi:hypothetical protein